MFMVMSSPMRYRSSFPALEIGFHPIKINVVALRGINDELIDMGRLT
jgi:hypothetical protein